MSEMSLTLRLPLGIALALSCLGPARAKPGLSVAYLARQQLPNVDIDGRPALIHTQGLYVTDEHYYVTGRLERPPQRAVLVRFDRVDPNRYEYLDITPETADADSERLDHPGGFDCDGSSFWIPVAMSRPQPPTAIVRLELRPEEPLGKWKARVVFRVDDHIGALAWEATSGLLYGANWDTKRIRAWTPYGKPARQIDHSQMVRGEPNWQVAIQDWKGYVDERVNLPGVLVAGGIDKSPRRDPAKSRAVIELLVPAARTRLARVYLPAVEGYGGPVTNEGLALHGGHLYLLPGDLGRDALIFRYRLRITRE